MIKKKIIFVHSSLKRGGAEHAMIRIANWLVERGWEVVIYLSNPGSENKIYKVNTRIRIVSYPNRQNTGLLRYIKHICFLHKTLVIESPEVLISMNSSQALDIWLGSCGIKVKRIACERSNPYISLKGTVWYYVKRIAAEFMDGYIFQTERASMYYSKRIRKRMAIIPNMIEQNNENSYNVVSRTILAVGNLRKVKRYDVLIEAFSSIKNKDIKLIICGEGKERSKLQQIIQELSLEDRVWLVGSQDNLKPFYQDTCIYILSSEHEGMPNSLMEAMANGLPCISTDCPMGPRELIRNGENGILIEVNSRDQLTDRINQLLSDPDLRLKLSKNAFFINETNNIERIGKMWERYLIEILN